MNELISAGLVLLILFVIAFAFGLSGGGSYEWKPSETNPFEGRHIHVRFDPETAMDPCPECDAAERASK